MIQPPESAIGVALQCIYNRLHAVTLESQSADLPAFSRSVQRQRIAQKHEEKYNNKVSFRCWKYIYIYLQNCLLTKCPTCLEEPDAINTKLEYEDVYRYWWGNDLTMLLCTHARARARTHTHAIYIYIYISLSLLTHTHTHTHTHTQTTHQKKVLWTNR